VTFRFALLQKGAPHPSLTRLQRFSPLMRHILQGTAPTQLLPASRPVSTLFSCHIPLVKSTAVRWGGSPPPTCPCSMPLPIATFAAGARGCERAECLLLLTSACSAANGDIEFLRALAQQSPHEPKAFAPSVQGAFDDGFSGEASLLGCCL
jgi:hypothetical protein